MLKVTSIILTLFFYAESLKGQDSTAVFITPEPVSLAESLPTLDSLILLAITNHPTIQLNEAMSQASFEKLKVQKRSWSTNVSGFYNYSLGNQSLIISGTANSDINNVANGYRYGVNLALPLSEFVQRGPRIKAAKSEFEASQLKVDEVSQVLARQVVEEYHYLLSAEELLRIKSRAFENSRINENLSEKAYREGSITILEYSRVMEMTATAEAEYVLARKDFLTAFRQFEILIGTELPNVQSTK
jgi:outer membrane protein TolC